MEEESFPAVAPAPLEDEMETPAESRTLQIPAGEVTLGGRLEIPENARGLVLFRPWQWEQSAQPTESGSRGSFARGGPRDAALRPALDRRGSGGRLFRTSAFSISGCSVVASHWSPKIIADDPISRKPSGLAIFGASTGGAAALRARRRWKQPSARSFRAAGGRTWPEKPWPCESANALIVGERDEEVLRLNESAYEKLRCEKSLAVVPRATHLFQERARSKKWPVSPLNGSANI
jgi:putative phosphoribosyl transferase